jgi:hypothetical protein
MGEKGEKEGKRRRSRKKEEEKEEKRGGRLYIMINIISKCFLINNHQT